MVAWTRSGWRVWEMVYSGPLRECREALARLPEEDSDGVPVTHVVLEDGVPPVVEPETPVNEMEEPSC